MSKIIAFLTNWKTSMTGIIQAVLSILVLTGVIDIEQSEVIEESTNSLAESLLGAILALQAIGNLFARDADKTSEDTGLNK